MPSTHRSAVRLILETAHRHSILCEIHFVEQGFIRVITPAAVEEGALGALQTEGNRVKVEVQYCRRDGDKFLTGLLVLRDASVQGRKEVRFPLWLPAHFFVIGDPEGKSHPAVLRDVSRSGFGFTSSTILQTGQQVQLDTGGGIIFGTVRYCVKLSEMEYRTGIQVDESMDREPGALNSRPSGGVKSLARTVFLKILAQLEEKNRGRS